MNIKPFFRTLAVLLLMGTVGVGCSLKPDYEAMGKGLAQIPPEPEETCEVRFGDALIKASGKENCDRLINQQVASSARQEAKEICSGMSPPGGQVSNLDNANYQAWYAVCVDNVMDGTAQIAMANALGAGVAPEKQDRTQREQGMLFMMQEAKNQSNERIAWISALVPAFTQLGLRTYDHLDNKSMNKVWRELAQSAGKPSNVHITKSDDGGAGGEGGSGRGGDGNQIINFGNNSVLSGAQGGSALSQTMDKGFGVNNPESSFEDTGEAPIIFLDDSGDGSNNDSGILTDPF